jgi:hypothetical protein
MSMSTSENRLVQRTPIPDTHIGNLKSVSTSICRFTSVKMGPESMNKLMEPTRAPDFGMLIILM